MINKVKTWKENQKTAEERFLELWKSCKKISKSKRNFSSLFYSNSNSIVLFVLNHDFKYLMCSYKYVWSIFKNEYKMTNEEIQEMVKKLIPKIKDYEICTNDK